MDMFVSRQPQSKVLGVLVMIMGSSGDVLNNYCRLQQLPVARGNLGEPKLLNEENSPAADIEETETSQTIT